jgi:hypothetical protein
MPGLTIPGHEIIGGASQGRTASLEYVPRLLNMTLGKASEKVPGLRRIPVVKLLSAAELALLARDHVARLSPGERRRLVVLVRVGRGRRSRLTSAERDELADLVAKLQPRLLMGEAINRLSPVPLPRRLVFGPKKRS